MKRILWIVFYVLCFASTGCVIHRVDYEPYINCRVPATTHATAIDGEYGQSERLSKLAELPHHSPREKYELCYQANSVLTSQLGSPDYVLIGQVYGRGNMKASLTSLKEAMCKKAAQKGGDAVLIVDVNVRRVGYSMVAPGSTSTNVTGSGYSNGNYAYGSAKGYTTQGPTMAFSGTLHLPSANGLVFKYVPGAESRNRKLLELNDRQIDKIFREYEGQLNTRKLTFEEMMQRWDQLIETAGAEQ